MSEGRGSGILWAMISQTGDSMRMECSSSVCVMGCCQLLSQGYHFRSRSANETLHELNNEDGLTITQSILNLMK